MTVLTPHSNLRKHAEGFCETQANFLLPTQRHIPKDRNLHSHNFRTQKLAYFKYFEARWQIPNSEY
jgi:hypothetical protein